MVKVQDLAGAIEIDHWSRSSLFMIADLYAGEPLSLSRPTMVPGFDLGFIGGSLIIVKFTDNYRILIPIGTRLELITNALINILLFVYGTCPIV